MIGKFNALVSTGDIIGNFKEFCIVSCIMISVGMITVLLTFILTHIFVLLLANIMGIKIIRETGNQYTAQSMGDIAYNYNNTGELDKLSEINEAAVIKADSDDIVNQLRNLFNVQM